MSSNKKFKQPELSVVVPLYNEESIIYDLIHRLNDACKIVSNNYEIVIVNDGSKDKTLSLLIGLSVNLQELMIVDLSRNFGHMNAVTAGLLNASGKAVVVMDGDLQDPPELIPKLYEKWQNGAEVVLANRTNRADSVGQKILTKFFYWTIGRISSCPIPKQVGTFCLIDSRVVKVINEMPERVRFFAGLRAWAGYRTDTVCYDRPSRKKGSSKVGFWGQVKLAKNGIVSFSNWPLIWLSRFSLLASLLLFFFGLIIVGIKLFSNLAIPGWASTMVLIGTLASMNSIVFAVFSEYLAIIFDEIKQRPHFLKSKIYRNGIVEEDIRAKACQKDYLDYRIHYTL